MNRLAFVLLLYIANALFCPEIFPIILTAPLFLIVTWNVTRIKDEYAGAADVFWFCIFLFFVISPLQTIRGTTIGGSEPVTVLEYSLGNFLTAMTIVVLFTLAFSLSSFTQRTSVAISIDRRFGPLGEFKAVAIALVAFGAYVVLSGGFDNLLAPRYEKEMDDVSIFAAAALGLLTIATTMLAAATRTLPGWNIKNVPFFALAVILLSIAQGPFNTSRFEMLESWLPIVLVIVHGKLRASTFYALSLIVIVVVFPILSISSRYGYSEFVSSGQGFEVGDFFKLPFIDVFDTLVHASYFMQNNAFYYGQKTLAILFFFFPRSLWPGKPIVGGLDIGNDIHDMGMYGTANLSFFIGGDFYMDFSFVGVVLGGFICGFIFSRATGKPMGTFYGNNIFEYCLMAALPILIRGPVGAVAALFTCQVFALLTLGPFLGRPVRSTPVEAIAITAERMRGSRF